MAAPVDCQPFSNNRLPESVMLLPQCNALLCTVTRTAPTLSAGSSGMSSFFSYARKYSVNYIHSNRTRRSSSIQMRPHVQLMSVMSRILFRSCPAPSVSLYAQNEPAAEEHLRWQTLTVSASLDPAGIQTPMSSSTRGCGCASKLAVAAADAAAGRISTLRSNVSPRTPTRSNRPHLHVGKVQLCQQCHAQHTRVELQAA